MSARDIEAGDAAMDDKAFIDRVLSIHARRLAYFRACRPWPRSGALALIVSLLHMGASGGEASGEQRPLEPPAAGFERAELES